MLRNSQKVKSIFCPIKGIDDDFLFNGLNKIVNDFKLFFGKIAMDTNS
jgi:hypothetical protein